MLENVVNQGLGLQRIAAPAGLRLMTLTSHKDEQGELPLMWELCGAWIRQGYSVMVLDATVTETDAQPGLLQLLTDAYWNEYPGTSTWSVLPAWRGLRHWDANGTTPQQLKNDLSELFPHHDIVLIYANAKMISRLFHDSGMNPVLSLSPAPAKVLSAYQSLKELLLNGRLQPTIVQLVDTSNPQDMTVAEIMRNKLQECTRMFLQREMAVMTVHTPIRDNANDDIEQLSLRLLESALPVTRPSFRATPSMTARSH